MTLKESVFADEEIISMAHAYASKKIFGRFAQLRLEAKLERKHLMDISMHSQKCIKELDKKIKLLDNEQQLRVTMESVIHAELAKKLAKKRWWPKKQAALQVVSFHKIK